MAYAFVNSGSGTTNALTYSPTPGNYLIVMSVTSTGGGSPIASIADNGSGSWTTQIATVSSGGDGQFMTLFTCGSAASSVTTITLTYSGGTPGTVALAVVEYSGLSPTGFIGPSTQNFQTTPGTAANAITTTNVNVTAQPAALFGWSANMTGNAGTTAGTLLGFTRRINVATNFIEDVRVTATGNALATATTSHAADDFSSYAFAISEGGGGGGNTASIAWVT